MAGQIDPTDLSTVLRDVYSATLTAADRAAMPGKLAAAFNAGSCLVHMRDGGPAGVTMIGGTANCEAFLSSYPKDMHSKDEWHTRGSWYPNRALLGEDLITEEELLRSDWYNDFCRPHDVHHLVGAVFGIERGVTGSIGVHRAPGEASFETCDRGRMSLLIPHLQQMFWLIRAADANARARQLSFDTLAALSVGVFVVGADNRVRLMNVAAERVVRIGAIAVRRGQLSLADAQLDDRLRAAIKRAALAPLGRSVFAGETIFAPARDGAVLSLKVMPVPPDAAASGPLEPLAAVLVGDVASGFAASPDAIRNLYNLTPAETRLMLALLNGETPAEYAERTGITLNTARTQLKSLFAKTGSNRQADLVRKVMIDPMIRLMDG